MFQLKRQRFLDGKLVAWRNCDSISNKSLICVNDECIDAKAIPDKPYVDILVEGLQVTELNVTQMKDSLSVDADDMFIGWESTDHGFVIRVIVVVVDANTTNVIAAYIEALVKECHPSPARGC